MRRPKLLDLCGSEGGAAAGYEMAGFDVTCLDIRPQPNNPFPFIQADAMTFQLKDMGFDAIALSPPCQGYTTLAKLHPDVQYPMLIAPLRERVLETGLPYILENVEEARSHLRDPVRLCGSTFALRVRRHRLFESNIPLTSPGCDHSWQDLRKPYKIHVGRSKNPLGYRESGIIPVHGGNHMVGGQSHFYKSMALGVDWMTEQGLNEAIPPAYTNYLGRQLIQHLS